MFIQSYIYNEQVKLEDFISIENPIARKIAQEYPSYGNLFFPGAIQLTFQYKVLFFDKLETDDLLETWLSLLESATTTKVDDSPDHEIANLYTLSSDGYFLEYRIQTEFIEINHFGYGREGGYVKKETITIPLDAYKSAVISGFNKFAKFIINANLSWAKDSAYHRLMSVYEKQPNK